MGNLIKILLYSTLFILFSMLPCLADGCIATYDGLEWKLFNEKDQICFINFENNIQNMVLSVDFNTNLTGEKAFWIFPIPSKPENAKININNGYPELHGSILEYIHYENLYFLDYFYKSQLTAIPLIQLRNILLYLTNSGGNGVVTHQKAGKTGLTSELITAKNFEAIQYFLLEKKIKLPLKMSEIINKYIDNEYCFVVTYISDINEYYRMKSLIKKDQNDFFENSYDKTNPLSVYISFKTEQIYYPLKLTSIYDDLVIPTYIYIAGYVNSNFYKEISKYSTISYRFMNAPYEPSAEFSGFFFNKPKIDDFKYTLLTINSPSKNFVNDLWINPETPLAPYFAHFINDYYTIVVSLLFIILSGFSSMLSGMLIFNDNGPSKTKFFFFGLFNFLTIFSFIIFSFILNVDSKFVNKNQTNVRSNLSRYIILLFIIAFFVLSYINIYQHIYSNSFYYNIYDTVNDFKDEIDNNYLTFQLKATFILDIIICVLLLLIFFKFCQ